MQALFHSSKTISKYTRILHRRVWCMGRGERLWHETHLSQKSNAGVLSFLLNHLITLIGKEGSYLYEGGLR